MVMKLQYSWFIIPCSIFLFASCSVSKQISKKANTILINDTAISTGHIGISIYEPATNSYWYNYNATKNFIPASNTKLFTLYAGMKYLGDSLVGLRYQNHKLLSETITEITPTGDPTFLHPGFIKQPVLDFLKHQNKIVVNKLPFVIPLGKGWAWDDYQETYMAPRNNFPLYGNVLNIKWFNKDSLSFYPKYFSKESEKTDVFDSGFNLIKGFGSNHLIFTSGFDKSKNVTFESDLFTGINLLKDTLSNLDIAYTNGFLVRLDNRDKIIHSQPSDSLFKPMMHRSDNFFAEQTLLMASNEHLGYMSDEKIIDTILKSDLKDIPQKPRWVDGSGLSRYNLFTPQSFVYILNKMKNEFGWERVKNILPTGGTGTLSSYYKKDSSFIYAKTGTLSNNCALSGYLITKKGKLLIFSILVNNYQSGATPVRKAVELFLTEIREKY
jgi:D-alanyl-D-alanine carboxypeptidase/D-alanyl-D-alanine-endopeptidase (penicillin-binding protein 4)